MKRGNERQRKQTDVKAPFVGGKGGGWGFPRVKGGIVRGGGVGKEVKKKVEIGCVQSPQKRFFKLHNEGKGKEGNKPWM